MEETIQNLIPVLVEYGVRVLGALVALWFSFRISAWFQRRLTTSLRARGFDETLALFFGNILKYAVLAAAVLACLGLFGIETTSFAALIGAAGLAVGLAFQGTLSNFAAGVMLLVFRPFKVGDYIIVGDKEGTVRELNLFVCSLDTLDGKRVILPNTAIGSGAIVNAWHNRVIRVDINVGVAYGSDLKQVRDVLDRAAQEVPHRDAEAGHQIFLAGLGASSVDFQVRIWTTPPTYWDVWDVGTQRVKEALDAAGIEIPFPQLDIHQDQPEPAASSSGSSFRTRR